MGDRLATTNTCVSIGFIFGRLTVIEKVG